MKSSSLFTKPEDGQITLWLRCDTNQDKRILEGIRNLLCDEIYNSISHNNWDVAHLIAIGGDITAFLDSRESREKEEAENASV